MYKNALVSSILYVIANFTRIKEAKEQQRKTQWRKPKDGKKNEQTKCVCNLQWSTKQQQTLIRFSSVWWYFIAK